MKKILYFFTIAALLISCAKDETVSLKGNYTLTGFVAPETKTQFGTPNTTSTTSGTIPFEWSAGDKIWSNGQQSGAAEIDDNNGKAVFSFANAPGTDVYYNMTGSSNQANVPAAQSIANNLGANGDFGYATVSNGSFTLEHATAYLWFDIAALPADATLKSISVSAGDVALAGKADWNGSGFKNLSCTSGEITLAINKNTVAAGAVDLVMVVLPAIIDGASVTYKLNIGGVDKYYQRSLNGKALQAGKTYRITEDLSSVTLYELRVLTFEDDDVQFSSYSLDYCSAEISSWSDLVAADQYMDELIYSFSQTEGDYYNWNDENNTFLAHHFPYNYSSYCYWGGGHAISNYVSSDYETYGDYTRQLTVYNGDAAEKLAQEGGGHNNSNNFCMHFGYIDGSKYNQTDELSSIYFSDGISRVIDHMWVANNTYAINCFINGNGLTDEMGEDDKFYVTASGFDENGTFVASTTIYLAEGKNYLSKWTKWDLSSLGKVASVQFNVCGTSDNGFGFSQPAYFAYDDVAVVFE